MAYTNENQQLMQKLSGEISKVIKGKGEAVQLILTALLAQGHVLIEDVPGVGKTTLAMALGKATGLSFRRAQFTPDVMASDITGFTMFNREENRFEYRSGLVMTNILLADEINRTSPKTQSALLEAMEEKRVTVDGVVHQLPEPFIVIATQNSQGYVGTFPLPEAQLDRFLLCLSLGYPEKEQELALLSRPAAVPESKPVATAAQLLAARQELAQVTVSAAVQEYLVELAHASREHRGIQLGLSTRGMLSLLEVSRAAAAMHGRTYVTPDDIKWIAADCMAHRMTARGSMWEENQETCRSIAEELLQTVPVPKESLWN